MSGKLVRTAYKHLQNTLSVFSLPLPSIHRKITSIKLIIMRLPHTSCNYDTIGRQLNFDVEELAERVQTKIVGFSSSERLTGIKTILKTLHNLPPHVEEQDNSETVGLENEESNSTAHEVVRDPSFGALTSTEVQSYQFSRNLNHIQQSLIKHPQLTAGENESSCTIISINLLHSNLGFGLKVITRLLNMNPEIFQLGGTVLKNRVENLRKHKLREGFLQRAVSHTPQYLTLPEAKINDVVNFLIGDLDFSVKELPELFLYSPQIFFDSLKSTEDKFQYIYFAMGYKKHYVLARHGIMRYSLRHIRTRHLFLERRGQFQMTDKNRMTTIVNPQLKKIICSSDAHFCREVALCKQDELSLFHRVLAIEDNLRRHEDEEDSESTMQLADRLLQEMKS